MPGHELLFAFGLTLFAGLATGVGSALAFFTRRTNTRLLCLALGFSAGVMLYVSFVEILAKARTSLVALWGPAGGTWGATLGFFGGIMLAAGIDYLVPSSENPHEVRGVEAMTGSTAGQQIDGGLYRMGLFAALAIAIHNFPEGLATFTAALEDPVLGLSIAVAIAIHNIPEGIAVSVPLYYATGNRKKAFAYSFLSGLAEPAGALIGYLLILRWAGPAFFGIIFALVAGIMVFISLDELLPAAEAYGEHHLAAYGLIGGMAVMALSLLLFLA